MIFKINTVASPFMTGFYRFFKLWCILFFCLGLTVSSYAQCSFTNLDPEYCFDAASFTLTGSTNYYGPGVSGTTFDPATAGVGTHTLYATSGVASAYNVSTSGTFNRIIPSGGTVIDPADDGEVTGITIPFTFNFFGVDYPTVRIGRNAIVGFGSSSVDVTDNQSMPSGAAPDNFIAAAWDDLDLGGTIEYFTTGVAPFRKFIIDYDAVPREGGLYNISTQIQLHESTNIIEIHTTSAPFGINGDLATQGIENSDGSVAYVVPGRNDESWDATNDYVAFIPTCLDIQTVTVNPLPNSSLGIAPATASVCPSGSVAITITGDESNVDYQLQNNTGSTPLSGFWTGNGVGNLLINSDPISTPLTLKVYARNNVTGCDTDLTTIVPVTINSAPSITTQPVASQTVCEGTSNVTFSVAATGTGLNYQWKKNGVNIGGATSSSYVIATATTADAATYTVEVSGTCSPGVTSNGSVLIIQEQPEITTQPAPTQTVCENQPVTLNVNAGATTNPTYQWYKGVTLIGGATSSSYTIPNVALGDAGSYTVVVSGTCGPSQTSNASVLNVNPNPTAFANDAEICSGGTTSIAITNPNGVPGTTFSWTVQSSNNVTGAGPGAGSSIAQSLSVTDGVSGGTVTYQIQPSAAGCNGPTFTVNVVVKPIPDVAFGPNDPICSGQSSNVVITNPNGVSGTTFTWVVQSSSNVIGQSAGSGALINQVLSSDDGVSNGTVTYRVTPTAGGCNGTFADVTVTVLPRPVITDPPTSFTASICSGDGLNILPNTSIPGTDFFWSSSVIGSLTGVSSSGTGAITDTPVNLANFPGIITYTVTPTLGGCNGTPVDYIITVYPMPDVEASDENICSGQVTNIAILTPNGVAGVTYSWIATSSNVTGASDGSGNNINQLLTSTGGGTVVYEITPTTGVCYGAPINVTVTVDPVPVITNTAAQLQTTICSGTTLNFTPTSSIGGTTYTWTSTVSGPITGATSPGSGAITNTLVNTGNVSGTVTYRITPSIGGCNGTPRDYVVTVSPVPNASASNETICSGQSSNVLITNPNGVSGTTFSWVVQSSTNVSGASAGSGTLISQVLTATNGITSGNVTYRITPTASGCNGATIDVTVTVNPAPVITNPSSQLQTTICSGTTLNFTPTSSIGGTTYTWTSTVSGPITGATSPGSGAITNTLVNTGNVSGTVTYRITPSIGGCNGTPRDYVVTVSPVPNASASNETICSGQSSNVLITNPNGVSGTTFSWVVQSSTNVSGASAGSGTLISQVLTATNGITSGNVTYRITPTASGCNGATIDVTVTVNPAPVITNPSSQLQTTICSGTTLNFTPTSSIGGTTYTWTSTVSGPITGATSPGSGAITNTLINTGNVAGTVTYTITPEVGGCNGTPRDYVVTVSPIPNALASNETICSGQSSNVLITNPNGVSGTTFSWVVQSSTNVSGASAGSGTLISQVLTATNGITSGNVTYRITPTASGCNGATIDVTVTVDPVPVITNTATQLQTTICSGTALNFTPTSSIGGTTYSWISVASGPSITGNTAGIGAITDVLVNTGNVAGTVTYTITPSTGGCNGIPRDYVVTVSPIPNALASNETICSGQSSNVLITNPNGVSGTTFSWVVQSSTNVSGASAGSGTLISQVLTATNGITSGNVTYRITPTASGCNGATIDVTVTVDPVPVITNTATQLQTTICSGTALNFTPTSSIGGTTYSWISVASGPSITGNTAGIGAITDVLVNTGNVAGTVTYTITPSTGGCNGIPRDYVVTVSPIPNALASNETICSGQSSNVLITNPNGVSGTTFSWVVQSSTNVSGASAGSGTLISQVLTATNGITSGNVTYRITPTASGCNGATIDVTVTVDPVPVITNTATQLQTTICSGTALNFTPTSSIGGTTYSWISVASGPSITGNTAGIGAITDVLVNTGNVAGTVTYTITPSTGGCNGIPRDYVVTVNPIPDADVPDNTVSICSGQVVNIPISNPNNVAGTTFNWTISSTNTNGASAGSGTLISQVLTSADGINSGSVIYTIIPVVSGCSGTPIVVTVTVDPVPVITNTSTELQTTICSGTALNFTPISSVPGTTYTWTSLSIGTLTGVSASGSGAVTDTPINTVNTTGIVIYTITPHVGSCSGAPRDYIVTVNPTPNADATDQGICSGQSSSVIISNPNNVSGTTYTWIVQSSTNVSGASAGSGALISQVLTSSPDITTGGSVVYAITPFANGCTGTPITVTVTVSPAPVITNTAAQLQATICSGTALNFTPTSSIGGTTYSWISNTIGPLTGVSPSGTGAIIDAPVNTGNASGTITYTITPEISGCSGTPRDYVVTVSPVPNASASDQGICSGQSSNVIISNPNGVIGTTFNWTVLSSSNVTGAANGSGNVISQLLISTNGVSAGSVIYEITPVATGCNGTPIQVVVTVSPSPVITNTATQLQTTICSGTALNFTPTSTIAGTTYTWTSVISGTVTGITTPSGSGAITDIPVNSGSVPGTVTYTITPNASGCNGTPRDYVVTVNPVPDVLASDQGICSGESSNVLITNPNGVVGTSFNWTIQSSSNVSGASNGTGDVISQVLTATDGISTGSVTYRIIPTANGCSGNFTDITVTVSPMPVITDPSTSFIANICSGDVLNLLPTSSIAGTTFTWTSTVIGTLSGVSAGGTGAITDTPINPTNVPGVIIYTVIPSIGGCVGTQVNYVVTVKPIPTVAASNQTICSGLSTSISITNPNAVAGTTYSWVVQNPVNVTGALDGSGNSISQVLTSTNGVSDGTVQYSITPSSNGCPGTPIVITVTVKAVPVIMNNPTDFSQQICSGDALNFLPITSIGGSTVTWTSTISGPIDALSVSASGSGPITDSPVNTSNVSGTVTYRIIPGFNGCDGTPVDLVVLVRPLPTATASDIIICSGDNATINISPAPKNVAGTTFSWTVTPSANVTGALNGNGSTISQTLSTTNASVGTVIYSIVPAANGCNGTPVNITVTVNPIATASAGSDFAVCEPVTIPLIGTLGGSASTGTWTIISGSGTLTSSTTSGTNVSATYTADPTDIGNGVVFRLTTNDPDNAGPCTQVFDEVTVTVNRQARLTLPADYAVCEPFSMGLTGTLSGSATSGTWSIISGAGILSASSVTGTEVTATYVVSNPTDVGTVMTFRLTTNDPDGLGPCTVEFDEIDITVNESPKVDAGLDFEVCEDQVISLNGSFSGSASFVTWSGGSGSAQFANVNAPNTTYTLTPADIAAGRVTLTLTTNDPDGGGPCSTVSDDVVIIINKLPDVLLSGLAASYAENDPPVLMVGFPNNPMGVFTGPGVLAGTNIFDPGNANIGFNIITYTYVDASGCANSDSQAVNINELTSIDFEVYNGVSYVGGTSPEICGDIGRAYLRGSPTVSTGLTPTVDTYFSTPDVSIASRIGYDGTDYYLDTDGLAAGSYYIQYTYTNSASATSTLIKIVTVYQSPIASILANNACEDDIVQFTDTSIVPVNALGGIIDKWLWDFDDQDLNSPLQNPTYIYQVANIYDVVLTVTTNQGCVNSTLKSITVGPPPIADFTWSGICNDKSTEFIDQSSISVSFSTIEKYQWDFGDGDETLFDLGTNTIPPGTHSGRTEGTYKDPSHDYSAFGEYNVKLTIETDVGCVKELTKRVFILDNPTPTPVAGYFEDFENGSGTWFKTSLSGSSWVFGPPSGETINSAASGTGAWWTGENPDAEAHRGTYYRNENSEVIGPCLNLTGLERPMISLKYWSDLEKGFDGAVVQYSTDGTTWNTLGDANGGGLDWYRGTNLSGNPGGQDNYAWSDTLGGWRNARFNLDAIPVANRDQVIFRIAFGSNDGNNLGGRVLNGFAFDDIFIGDKKRNVLVEYFTNVATSGADAHFNSLIDNQASPTNPQASVDFFKLEYHVEPPAVDSLYLHNPSVPSARGLLYGVSQPPAAVMDGLLGWYKPSGTDSTYFNGTYNQINEVDIDRRSLEDPLFDIQLTIDPLVPAEENKVKGHIEIRYTDATKDFTDPVIVQLALVDESTYVDYTESGKQKDSRYVVRKLILGNEGVPIDIDWSNGTTQSIPFEQVIDIPITNGGNQYLVAFVQDKLQLQNGQTKPRYIHQSVVSPAIQRKGVRPVGLEDDPIAAEIRDIQIYPNPANNILKFRLKNKLTRDYTWRMIDQRGITVLSGDVNQFFEEPQEIDISQLANGIYFIQIGIGHTSLIYRKIAVMNRN